MATAANAVWYLLHHNECNAGETIKVGTTLLYSVMFLWAITLLPFPHISLSADCFQRFGKSDSEYAGRKRASWYDKPMHGQNDTSKKAIQTHWPNDAPVQNGPTPLRLMIQSALNFCQLQ